MNKYRFSIICLVPLLILYSGLADAGVKVLKVTPKVLRQNDIKVVVVKGKGFQEDAEIDMGKGITVLSAGVTNKKIKAQITVEPDASLGKRTVVVTNPDGGKGQKKNALKVKKCEEDCEELEPFDGNPVPVHNKSSSLYRTDCTNASCHRGILKETSLDTSVMTFHVIKVLDNDISKYFGTTTDKKCLYCHENTDLIERSAGNLRKNVDVSICHNCHTEDNVGKEFYKMK